MIIRKLLVSDIDKIVTDFNQAEWPKPSSLFQEYLKDQESGKRIIWVAYIEAHVAGYVTLNWESQYQPFFKQKIPEIMDLNVLPTFRNRGIGTKLLEIAETEAANKSSIVGIGVGLYDGYGAAQKLYVQRGYIPDGKGITYKYQSLNYGVKEPLNDDLILWLTKEFKKETTMTILKKLLKIEQESRDFGFEWPDREMILDQVNHECTEIRQAIDQKESQERIQEEIGDLLHAVISLNRFSGFDLEDTLQKVYLKFENRMAALKKIARQRGLEDLQGQSIEFMLDLWKEVKKGE